MSDWVSAPAPILWGFRRHLWLHVEQDPRGGEVPFSAAIIDRIVEACWTWSASS